MGGSLPLIDSINKLVKSSKYDKVIFTLVYPHSCDLLAKTSTQATTFLLPVHTKAIRPFRQFKWVFGSLRVTTSEANWRLYSRLLFVMYLGFIWRTNTLALALCRWNIWKWIGRRPLYPWRVGGLFVISSNSFLLLYECLGWLNNSQEAFWLLFKVNLELSLWNSVSKLNVGREFISR